MLSSKLANFDGRYPYGTTAPGPFLEQAIKVGSYEPNGFGLYDMHGNVWEWCADRCGPYDKSPVVDQRGPSTGTPRVLRGGGWGNNGTCCRSAMRLPHDPSCGHNECGFRVPCEP